MQQRFSGYYLYWGSGNTQLEKKTLIGHEIYTIYFSACLANMFSCNSPLQTNIQFPYIPPAYNLQIRPRGAIYTFLQYLSSIYRIYISGEYWKSFGHMSRLFFFQLRNYKVSLETKKISSLKQKRSKLCSFDLQKCFFFLILQKRR